MKPFLRHAGLTVALLAAGGFLVAAAGIVRVTVTSGHLPPVRWFLEFAMHRSIATHTLGDEAPGDLDDLDRVVRGAAHYAIGCAPCHGAPGEEEWQAVEALLPGAPPLSREVSRWEPEELHYIVKHGVKMTGMPAWPTLARDDEVWDMVAFMLALPGLDAAGYARLAGEAEAERPEPPAPGPPRAPGAGERTADAGPPPSAGGCARCHGRDGLGRGGAFPPLAGQSEPYLAAALDAYAEGRRPSGMMETVAAVLDPAEREELAGWYAGMDAGGARTDPGAPATPEPAAPDPPPGADLLDRGRAIALGSARGERLPVCSECHGPGPGPRDPAYPRLDGLPADYIATQLRLFRAGVRGGTEHAHLMDDVVRRLDPEDDAAVAAWYARRPDG